MLYVEKDCLIFIRSYHNGSCFSYINFQKWRNSL
uniref:Uncharacterized protein n=1 Tax=Siphoviridae sp. ctSOv1 TaxID=2827872 RepID=A0A8S5SZZ8_9CAUD|nr:MAG TPA: hypothetical protein [Siphoviridae sp. ctSOv1]